MKDTRKIRITLHLDVTLDQSEYGPDGQSAEAMLEYIQGETDSPSRVLRLIDEWNLIMGADFNAEIVE